MKDVIVVGSGPAGALAASIMAEEGLAVQLFDKKAFPRAKQCGDGLTARVNDIIPFEEIAKLPGANKNHGLRMISPSKKYVATHYREGNNGYFVSRVHFDNYLHEKALNAGASFHQEKVISAKYTENGVQVTTKKNSFDAKLLVIANGFYSRLPAMFGFPKLRNNKYIGLSLNSSSKISEEKIAKYFGEKALTTIFLGIAKNGYGYVFTMKNRINIGVGGTEKYVKNIKQIYADFIIQLKEFYGIEEDLPLTKPRGYRSPFYKPMKKAYTDRVMVVGDAAWMINALTGEGVYYALVAAKLAAETAVKAIEKNDTSAQFLKSYNDKWTESFGKDLSKYAFPVKNMLFSNDRRMELAVKIARKDKKMMNALTQTITNSITIKEGYRRLIKRAPIALLKRAPKK